MEREERALHFVERDVADRETRVATREKLLAEREAKVRLQQRGRVGETRGGLEFCDRNVKVQQRCQGN